MQKIIRVAAGSTKYAIVRIPFGWHQAPGLVQHLVARVLSAIEPEPTLIIQYLDDLLFVDANYACVKTTAQKAAHLLTVVGYIISPKSVLDPVQDLSWMGKRLNLLDPRIAPSHSVLADVVAPWIKFSLKPYHYKSLGRLLGRIVWMGRPGNISRPFLAGARSWLNKGP